MVRTSLGIVAAYYLSSGIYMVVAPTHWYDAIPGVASTGPLNLHFVRDIGLVFLASAGALFWGAARGVRSTAVAGAAWPCLHALVHAQMWVSRGLPLDAVSAINLTAIQMPAWLALWAAVKLPRHQKEGRNDAKMAIAQDDPQV